MSQVFVLANDRAPMNPIHPGYARRLLTQGKAVVFRRFPFTILLKEASPLLPIQPLRLKLDPGSKTTGLALVNDTSGGVVWAAELTHRGQQVSTHLAERRAFRRNRRARKTRYRKPRFQNRRRKPGWLLPALESRIVNVTTWVARLIHLAPIGALSQEVVKFDVQALQNPEIKGVEYQQGTLAGYELREYLLEKWQRRCAYCGQQGIPLQIDHVIPKARGGSNRVSNLVLACRPCNTAKGTQTASEFGHPEVQAQAKKPLKDAAAVNATRWALYERLQASGITVEVGTGGHTKFNRFQRGLPKSHWVDAANVGASTPPILQIGCTIPLLITATGWQSRQMCQIDARGFPRARAKRCSHVQGFQTGDLVRAVVTRGIKVGTYVGRVAVRATGSFDIRTKTGLVQGINARYCQIIQQADGYTYQRGEAASFGSLEGNGCPSQTWL